MTAIMCLLVTVSTLSSQIALAIPAGVRRVELDHLGDLAHVGNHLPSALWLFCLGLVVFSLIYL